MRHALIFYGKESDTAKILKENMKLYVQAVAILKEAEKERVK